MLEFVENSNIHGWTESVSEVDYNAIQRSLGWSFYQTLCKDNHSWVNLHFSFNDLFYNLFDDWNKNPCFFVSWYS